MADLRPFYFRDHKNANRFKPNITPPRLNFAGFVEFVFSPEVQFLGDIDSSGAYREQISSLIQTATLPSVSFNTQIKNQYNKKRIVNTGVDYAPIDLSVIDTVNNEWAVLLMRYFSYLYMNPRNKTTGGGRDPEPKGYESASDVQSRNSMFMADTFDSNAAGLDANVQANFFDHIKIVTYHAGRGTEYIIFKPMITQFDLGTIDYTSSEFRQFRLQLEYENFTINNHVNFKMNEQDLSRFENLEGINWLVNQSVEDSADRNPIYGGSENGRPVNVTGDSTNPRTRTPQTPPSTPKGTP